MASETGLKCTPGYPVRKRLSAKYDGTFAAKTLKDRLPRILTQVVDTVHRHEVVVTRCHGEAGREALKTTIGQLSELRYLMQTDKPMVHITSGNDAHLWREVFETYRQKLGEEPSWFAVSWLFFECYMYRRIMEIIRSNEFLMEYDPFREQKEKSFSSSLDQIRIIGQDLVTKIEQSTSSEEELRCQYDHWLMLCLWGNKMDLSMSVTMDSYDATHQLKTSELHHKVLANQSQKLWEVLSSTHKESRTAAIVLDNSGFELFTDLCFAEWLLSTGLASRVVLHCKSLPWFISDVTEKDFQWTLEQLCCSGDSSLSYLGQKWQQRVSSGSLVIVADPFWTTSYEYASMSTVAPALYKSLSSSFIIVFKGDLNYRKLVSDRNWTYTEDFVTALEGFVPTSICALRTLKADLVAGLPAGAADRASSELPGEWMVSGQYAVVQVYKQS